MRDRRGTLAQGIAAAMHSDETPSFADIVSKSFASATPEQKAGMLNTLLASATPEQRAQIAKMIPSAAAAAPVTGAQAAAMPTDAVSSLADRLHQGGAAIVDKMSAFYAEHPGLVKAIGTSALVIAMRRMAERHR